MFVMIILSILLSSALVLIFPGLQNVNRAVWILVKNACSSACYGHRL